MYLHPPFPLWSVFLLLLGDRVNGCNIFAVRYSCPCNVSLQLLLLGGKIFLYPWVSILPSAKGRKEKWCCGCSEHGGLWCCAVLSFAHCHVNERKLAYWMMRYMALSSRWPQLSAGSQPTWSLARVACVSPAKTVRTAQLSPAKIADQQNHQQLKMIIMSWSFGLVREAAIFEQDMVC